MTRGIREEDRREGPRIVATNGPTTTLYADSCDVGKFCVILALSRTTSETQTHLITHVLILKHGHEAKFALQYALGATSCAWGVISTKSQVSAFEQWRGLALGSEAKLIRCQNTAVRHQGTKRGTRTVESCGKSISAHPEGGISRWPDEGRSLTVDYPFEPHHFSPVNHQSNYRSLYTSSNATSWHVTVPTRLAFLEPGRILEWVHILWGLEIF